MDRELIQQIKSSVGLINLISNAIELKRSGSGWIGLCPFHIEHSPSFFVTEDRGFYHCFGCGKHGDVFTWVMEREGLTFFEALEYLARSIGLNILSQSSSNTDRELILMTKIRSVIELAHVYYKTQLQDATVVLKYLSDRSISNHFIKEAGFGYAPNGWSCLVDFLKKRNIPLDIAEQAGLITKGERGNYIDFLRNRLVIPIHDSRGHIVAFGGRNIDNKHPKYINTRETLLFDKSAILFGFNKAKGFLRNGVLIVEGYFDVLQLHQNEIYNVVASLGTNLTKSHLQMISRLTKKIILCFDGDHAGISAMEKGLKLSLSLGFQVKVLLLPRGTDPDNWCLHIGSLEFCKLIELAPDWTNFIVNRMLNSKNLCDVSSRIDILNKLSEFFVFLPNTLEHKEIYASLAYDLKIPLSDLDKYVSSKRLDYGVVKSSDRELSSDLIVDDFISHMIILCYRDMKLIDKILLIPLAWWQSLKGAAILQNILYSLDKDIINVEILSKIGYIKRKYSIHDRIEIILNRILIRMELSFIECQRIEINRHLNNPIIFINFVLREYLVCMQEFLLQRGRQIRYYLKNIRQNNV